MLTPANMRGVSFDLARELAKRIGKPLDFKPIASPPLVIDAVRSGQADIGFVAYQATKVGTVEFSQTYMLVQQSFLVLGICRYPLPLPISTASVRRYRACIMISITLCLRRTLKQATLVELDNNPELIAKALVSREIDALAPIASG